MIRKYIYNSDSDIRKKKKTLWVQVKCFDLQGVKFILNLHPPPQPPTSSNETLLHLREERHQGGWGSEGSSQHQAAHTCPRTKTPTPVGAEVRDEDGVGAWMGGLQAGQEQRINVTETCMVTELSARRRLRGCVCVWSITREGNEWECVERQVCHIWVCVCM